MTKSRKKILLSSIAMLLVALVALGSATYAWFTINKTVEAKQMQVKAATAQGLQITGNNGSTWGRVAEFGQTSDETGFELNPVSLAYTSSAITGASGFYPQDVKTAGAYVAAAGDDPASATKWTSASLPVAATSGLAKDTTKYFAAYEVGIKSTSGEIGAAITATLGFTDDTAGSDGDGHSKNASDFIRIIVVDQGTKGAYTITDPIVASYGTGASAVKTISGSGDAAAPASYETNPDASTSFTISANTIGQTAHYYTMIVWYEGQDEDCINAGQLASGKITLNFTY